MNKPTDAQPTNAQPTDVGTDETAQPPDSVADETDDDETDDDETDDDETDDDETDDDALASPKGIRTSKLIQHFSHTEKVLKALYRVSGNAGHGVNMGTAREDFVKVFLEKHVGRQAGIGQGEILDYQTRNSDASPQLDVVLYDTRYPKIDFGGNISGYLAESVIATIEIKSKLNEKQLLDAFSNAVLLKQKARSLLWKRSMVGDRELAGRLATLESRVFGRPPPAGSPERQRPHFHCYLLAYDGPAKMTTVHEWLPTIYKKCGIEDVALSWDERRGGHKSPGLDGIFVLERGAVVYENMPFTLIGPEDRMQHPTYPWCAVEDPSTSLWQLFMRLQVLQDWARLYEWEPYPYFTSELPSLVTVNIGPPRERKPRKPRKAGK